MENKNYEVIAYRQTFGEGLVITKSSGENVWYTAAHESENYEIFTVQRKTDGEVFSIGDKLGNWSVEDGPNTIVRIGPLHNTMWLYTDISNGWGEGVLSAEKNIEKGKAVTPDNILKTAENLIYGDRQASYGSVTENFGRIAQMWSAILGVEVCAADVGLCMIAVKLARQVNKASDENLIDICGYAGCLEKLNKGE